MQIGNPVEDLAAALHHAALIGLPTLEYEERDFELMYRLPKERRAAMHRGDEPFPMVIAQRRPHYRECEVVALFPQTWGSTALGFSGIGGAAMTPAYTTVIRGPDGSLAVYWGGSFGYLVTSAEGRERLIADISRQVTASRWDAKVYEAADPGATAPVVSYSRSEEVSLAPQQSPVAVLASSLYRTAARMDGDGGTDVRPLVVAGMFAEEGRESRWIEVGGRARPIYTVIIQESHRPDIFIYRNGRLSSEHGPDEITTASLAEMLRTRTTP